MKSRHSIPERGKVYEINIYIKTSPNLGYVWFLNTVTAQSEFLYLMLFKSSSYILIQELVGLNLQEYRHSVYFIDKRPEPLSSSAWLSIFIQ